MSTPNYAALAASNGSGEPVRVILTAPRSIGSTTLTGNTPTNWPTGTFIATTGTLQSNGTLNPTTAQVFYGTVSGSNLTITAFAAGYSDLGNSIGDVVVLKPTTEWADIVAQGVEATTQNNLSKFSAYRNASLSSPNNTQALLTFDVTSFDTESNYSTSTGRFTATVAGFYKFSAQAQVNNGGSSAHRIFLSLYKNGTELYRGLDNNYVGTDSSVFCSSIDPPQIQLAANDYIQIFIYTSGILTVDVGTTPIVTYFGGSLVSTI